MLRSDEIRLKMQQAQQLAELKHSAGWTIIEERIESQVALCREKLCQRGLDHQQTEELRYQIYVMQWLLRSVELARPEQFAKWEGELAFHVKQEKMREQAGLPANAQELINEEPRS
jgi:hypothetical protein